MLQFLLRLLLLVVFARLVARLVRLLRHDEGRRGSVAGGKPRRRRTAAELGGDIVDAEFEEISRKQEP